LREFLDLCGHHFNGLAIPRFKAIGFARRHGLHAFAKDRFCQNGGRRRAVTRHVAGLRRDFLQHLGAIFWRGSFNSIAFLNGCGARI
jgi:hypothetical protein